MNEEFLMGIVSGLIASAGLFLMYRAHQYGKAMDLTEFDQVMTHDALYYAAQHDRLVVLMDTQVEELCEEFGHVKEQLAVVQSHLDEALTRKTELHKEVSQMARVANQLQDQLTRALLETDHCRATCDELREKLSAKVGA